jgi:hypothetical protein
MRIEFQLIGEGDLPPSVESAAVPQRGDIVEFGHTNYLVTGIRYVIERDRAALIVVEIQHQ